MNTEAAKVDVAEGDFVEATFIGDRSIIRRGVVITVFNSQTVVVKGWNFESLCDQPKRISSDKLTAKDRDLINLVTRPSGNPIKEV